MEPQFNKKYPATPEEQEHKELIAQFRHEIRSTLEKWPENSYCQEIVASDRACLRYLKARKFNDKAAAKFFGESVEMREAMNLDTLLDDPLPVIEKIKMVFPHTWHGYDKQGRPIYIDMMGDCDVTMIEVDVASKEDLLMFHSYKQEYCRRKVMQEASRRTGRRVDQSVGIIDLGNLGAHHNNARTFSFFTSISTTDQCLYPETLSTLFIVNAGWMFSVGYSIISTFLDAHTRSKFRIFSGVPTEELLELIDADNLPMQFGGKCRCAEKCLALWDDVPNYRPAMKAVEDLSEEELNKSCLSLSPALKDFILLTRTGEAAWKHRHLNIGDTVTAVPHGTGTIVGAERDKRISRSPMMYKVQLKNWTLSEGQPVFVFATGDHLITYFHVDDLVNCPAFGYGKVVGRQQGREDMYKVQLLNWTLSDSQPVFVYVEGSQLTRRVKGGAAGAANLGRRASVRGSTQAPPITNADACFDCKTAFGLWYRRHHCRNCGNAFCSTHAARFIPLPHFNLPQRERVCDPCYFKVLNHEM